MTEDNLTYYHIMGKAAEDMRGLSKQPKWVTKRWKSKFVNPDDVDQGEGFLWTWLSKKVAEYWTMWMRKRGAAPKGTWHQLCKRACSACGIA